jgi:hypothetical protein
LSLILFCFVLFQLPHKPRSSCFLSLKFPAFLLYNFYHTRPCSLLKHLQSFSGIIIIIEFTPEPIPEPYHGYAIPRVTQAERKKHRKGKKEGKGYIQVGRKDNRLLWHRL